MQCFRRETLDLFDVGPEPEFHEIFRGQIGFRKHFQVIIPLIQIVLKCLIVGSSNLEVLKPFPPISVHVHVVDFLGVIIHPQDLSTAQALLVFEQIQIGFVNHAPELPMNERVQGISELVVQAFKLGWSLGPMKVVQLCFRLGYVRYPLKDDVGRV